MSEELLMRLASYDGYDEHIADHGRMLEALQSIGEYHRLGESDQALKSLQATLLFLTRHIQTRDAQFASWKRE